MTGSVRQPFPALAIDMNSPGNFVHWSIFYVSVANLVLIAVMVVIFGAALLLPFPRGHREEPGAVAGGVADGGAAAAAAMLMMARRACGRPGCGAARCSAVAAGQAAAGPAARLRGVLGVCVRGGVAGRAGGGDRVRVRARSRRPGLVALQPGRAFLQQPASVERRVVHGAAGHPPVGQVLDGGLARPPGDDLDHRCGRVRGLGAGVLHRVCVAAELRLAVDLHQRQGRVQLRRGRRVLQRDELRPDAAVARGASPDRAGRHRRRARAAGPDARGVAPDRRASAGSRAAGGSGGAPSQQPTLPRGAVPPAATTS